MLNAVIIQPANERAEFVVIQCFLSNYFRKIDGRRSRLRVSGVGMDHILIDMVINVVTLKT
jgi:hypothetical protein